MIAKELQSLYLNSLDVRMASRRDPTRILYLRPSQLPFCPLAFFCNHAMMGTVTTLDMAGGFYTSIGTEVHEVLQTYLGTHGKFLADWECPICKGWKRASFENECCDFPSKYHELGIDYKGVQGHVDCVFRDSKGRLWVVDFKTTSVKGAAYKQTRPPKEYVEQIETYALFLRLQYKLDIHGICLMFVKRDNVRELPTVWSKELKSKDFSRIKARTLKYRTMHREVINASTKAEVLALAQYGRCSAPYCRFCKKTDSPKKQLLAAYEMGLKRGHLPIRDLVNKTVKAKD